MPTTEDILNALSSVIDPELGKNLVSLGMIHDVRVEDEVATFTLRLTTPAYPIRDHLEQMARQAVIRLPGIHDVNIKVEANVPAGYSIPGRRNLHGVRQVIAVASGKGGVGKTTVAVNLALTLAESGVQVGILDADFYGPNVPQMLGSNGSAHVQNDKFVPIESFGLHVMSFAYLVSQGKPLIWRGPLLMGALHQMLFDVDWHDLDYLVVDLPPGTGDIPLSLVQEVCLAGVVVVTTPQSVAVSNVQRCIDMFQVTDTPVLGIVENMSFLVCPDCGRRLSIFGHGGGHWLADLYDIPLLGQIPLLPSISEGNDLGLLVGNLDPTAKEAFGLLAGKVAAQVSIRQLQEV